MNDMRRTLLWVVFTMSLVMIWDSWNRFNGHPSMFSPNTGAPGVPAHPSRAPTLGAGGLPAPATPSSPTATLGSTTPGADLASQTVTIQTDLVQATLDTRGGDLVGLELLKYRDGTDPKKHVMLFDRGPSHLYLAQSGLLPSQPGAALPNHLTVMRLVSPERQLADGKNELQLRFESPEIGGVQLVKTYIFRRGQYTIGLLNEVVNHSAQPVSPQLYLQLVRDGHVESTSSMGPSAYTGPAIYTDATKFRKISFKDIDKDKVDPLAESDNGWIAMVQHYFASAWMIDPKKTRNFRISRLDESVHGLPAYSVALLTPVGTVAPGASQRVPSVLFAGPQEEKQLAAIAPGLELVKDYGILKVLAEPLFWLLDKLHTLIGNWGWAIVALVVVLKVAFYGLNASAYRSMAKMKAINPKVQELRERYKDKPQQMQQEMMRIYREEKVNPLGGCLPILVQMPFFISLYWVLLSTVEMRGAPWLGWITDLSTKDPYFILPLLMTGTSLFQVWLQPAPADPTQAKMMWIMPLAFSVMFFFFPSGLVLYWLTNNLLSIAQQWLINRQISGAPSTTSKAVAKTKA